MRKHSYLFLRDAWEPETLADFKNTIVFTNDEKGYKEASGFIDNFMHYEKTNSYYCHGSSNDSLHRSEANNRYPLE